MEPGPAPNALPPPLPPAPPASLPARRPSPWTMRFLYLAAIFLGLGLLIAIVGYQVVRVARVIISPVTETTQERITTIVERVKQEGKLVVATQTLSYTVEHADTRRAYGVYLGTTWVKITVDQCRVQYLVPLEHIRSEDFYLDPAGKKLVACLPRPQLDSSFADVPTDPALWHVEKSAGWARFNKNTVEEQLRQNFRHDLITATAGKKLDDVTERAARDSVEKLIKTFLNNSDLTVEVRWQS